MGPLNAAQTHPEPAQDLRADWTRVGCAPQESTAEGVQIVGDVRDTVARRGWIDRALQREDVDHGALERWTPDEALVEHDADAVPVGGGAGRLGDSLLRCHVASRPHDLVPGRELRRFGVAKLGDHPEVEQDDSSLRSHDDVRRLHIAMELAGGVQRLDALNELGQPVAEPVHIRQGRGAHGRGREAIGRAGRRTRLTTIDHPGGGRNDRRRDPPQGRVRIEPADVPQKVDPRYELHRKEDDAGFCHHEFVQSHEVVVLHACERPELLLEEIESSRVHTVQCLEGNVLFALAVERLVDDPHAAFA